MRNYILFFLMFLVPLFSCKKEEVKVVKKIKWEHQTNLQIRRAELKIMFDWQPVYKTCLFDFEMKFFKKPYSDLENYPKSFFLKYRYNDTGGGIFDVSNAPLGTAYYLSGINYNSMGLDSLKRNFRFPYIEFGSSDLGGSCLFKESSDTLFPEATVYGAVNDTFKLSKSSINTLTINVNAQGYSSSFDMNWYSVHIGSFYPSLIRELGQGINVVKIYPNEVKGFEKYGNIRLLFKQQKDIFFHGAYYPLTRTCSKLLVIEFVP